MRDKDDAPLPLPQSITFAGAAHMDRIGQSHAPLMPAGSNPGRFHEYPGGAALNTASIFAALGGDARLLTLLGKDSATDTIRDQMLKRGVHLIEQQRPDRSTGNYTAILNSDGELNIALADMEIYEHFDAAAAKSEIDPKHWLCIDANLPETGLKALCNSHQGPIAALTVSAAKASRLASCLPDIDLLFTNRKEAAVLTGSKVDNLSAEHLAGLGIPNVVVTNGPQEVVVIQHREQFELPVPQTNPVADATGAGDALAGATLFALGRGAELQTAVKTGIAAAQAILQVRGPWRDGLREAMNFSKEKISPSC